MHRVEVDLRLIIFDLTMHMHLPTYLRYLIEYWSEKNLRGMLSIVVWHTFFRSHADVVQLAEQAPHNNIRFITLTKEEMQKKISLESADQGIAIAYNDLLRIGASTNYAALFDWELFCRHAIQVSATHGFIIHLDHYLPLLSADLTSPTQFSGIYFSPTFHYPKNGRKDEATHRLQEKMILARALRHPKLTRLFFLDPCAVEHTSKFTGGEKAAFLADPARLDPASPERITKLRSELDILPDRMVFLLFGHLTKRKGIRQLLEAIRQLPCELCRQLCLILAGTIHPNDLAQLEQEITATCAVQPVQIVRRYEYIPHSDVPAFFRLADVVLAPYPRHAGMSGILLIAAAAQKPVLSSQYGLMGEITRRYQLGLAVDVTQPGELAKGLAKFLETDPAELCDSAKMRLLAEQHVPDRFAAQIFQHAGFLDKFTGQSSGVLAVPDDMLTG
jgi:glycosyltransferase involved in cell wall biosynthesis